jgi:hypothetical protein
MNNMSRTNRKISPATNPWVPARMCPCCGKVVVKLRLPTYGSKTDPRWTIVCYAKGWDGDPNYIKPGEGWKNLTPARGARPHTRKPVRQKVSEPEPEDPFFNL